MAKAPLLLSEKQFDMEKVSAVFYDPFYDVLDYGTLAARNTPLPQ